MNTPGDRIRTEREDRGMSQTDLGNAAGIGKSSVCQWESGRTKIMNGVNLVMIAMALGLEPYWIVTGKGRKFSNNKSNLPSQPKISELGINRIPLIDFEKAGSWMEELSNHVPSNGDPMITENLGNNVFAVIVPSDSMQPEFYKGETILIDPNLIPQHEDFILAEFGGDVVLRQYWREAGEWWLKPLNSRYDIELLGDNLIIGSVIEKVTRRKYK